VDEIQPDVILTEADLADPRADDAPASLMKIAESTPTDELRRVRGDGGDDIPQLQHDILQVRRRMLEKGFDRVEGEHGLLLVGQPHKKQTVNTSDDRTCEQ
jgi:hypothetical protein